MNLSATQIPQYCELFGRWQVRTIHGQQVLYTTNLGSYLRFRVLKHAAITINALNNGNPLANPQVYAWRIAGRSWQRVAVDEMPLHIVVDHSVNVEIMTAGNNDIDQVWTGNQGFAITSMAISGKITKAEPRQRLVAIGDSITAGCWVAGKNSSFDYRPESNYLQLAADQCGFDVDRIAYSASGVLAPGTGGVPSADKWIDHIDRDNVWQARPCQLVLVNLGTNDHQPDPAVFCQRFVALIKQIQKQWPAPVIVLTPISQRNASLIANAARQTGCQLVSTQGWCHHFTDHTHPNQAGSVEIAKHLVNVIQKMKGASTNGK
ncbi:GDSL-type esterase/lipase family protein [Limosilactobacillus sp.]|uniref:GDSL-type esterase/lipase family protein n=1 Tax=Limosilactobacillus sp. TaxID=2773925 RepID=UPI00345E0AFB